MTDRNESAPSSLDDLIAGSRESHPDGDSAAFATVFRGYDRAAVDAAIDALRAEGDAQRARIESLARDEQNARGEAQSHAETIALLEAKAAELEAGLALQSARADNAEDKVQTLTADFISSTEESSRERERFEDVLRVAEDQASVIIKNASAQAERLLQAARAEIVAQRASAQADIETLRSQASTDAAQARLTIDTELTAHTAQLEREGAHAAEKVTQAEQEAAAIRTEAEKGAAALRSLVARETEQARAEAEEAVREHRMRALEFEEALSRRQDDAQQEFLMLHNQAVAHAERITQDANEQVAASLEHAQRITAKADDFDKLMRAQAQQHEADARLRSREILDRASVKAQKILDAVTGHSQGVLRDAEDRARALRWQQQQLTSFMSEVKELMRTEATTAAAPAAEAVADAGAGDAGADDGTTAQGD